MLRDMQEDLCPVCSAIGELKTPRLNVLIGISGAGKSSWLNSYRRRTYHIVCPDDIRRKYFGSVSDQTVNVRAWMIAKGMLVSALTLKKNTILDATNVNTAERIDILNNLPLCDMYAILFEVNPAVAYTRIVKDIKNRKDRCHVPEYEVYRMHGLYLHTKDVIHKENFKKIIFAKR